MKKSVLALAFLLTAAARLSAAEYVNGVFVEYFSYKGTSLSSLPDFSKRNADLIAIESDINHAGTTRAWEGLDDTYKDTFASRHRAFIEIPASGLYTFSLESDDGSALFIDGSRLILNDGVHAMARKDASIELEAGLHDLRVDFFENGGDAGLRLYWASAAFAREIVPAGAFWIECQDGFDYGLDAEFFDCSALGSYSKLPSVIGMESVLRTTVANIRYPSVNTAWPGMPEGLVDRFNARFTGFINIEEAGDYTFYLNSDDGSFLYIDGEEVVANDGSHSMVTKSGTRHLEAGLHRFRIEYAEFTGGAGLLLDWEGPGFSKCPVPSKLLLHADDAFDADGDGMSDRWEIAFGLDPDDAADAERDLDGDGISNREEFESGLDPHVANLDPELHENGLWAEFYSFKGETIPTMPSFKNRTYDVIAKADVIDYGRNVLVKNLGGGIFASAFAARFYGFIRIPVSGEYTFRLRSDDGAQLWIGEKLAVNNDGCHSARDVNGKLVLEAGDYPIRVEYFNNAGDNELSLFWTVPGGESELVPYQNLFRRRSIGLLPEAAISYPSADASFALGEKIGIRVKSSDLDGSIAKIELYANGELVAEQQDCDEISSFSWQNRTIAGVVQLTAAVYDNEGRKSVSEPVRIFVYPEPTGFSYGLDTKIFRLSYGPSSMPDFANMDPSRAFRIDTVNFPQSSDQRPWDGLREVYEERTITIIDEHYAGEYTYTETRLVEPAIVNHYGAVVDGYLWVRESGIYTLTLRSDDGSILKLDGETVINGDGAHSMCDYSATLRLKAGIHPLEIQYFENSGDAGLILSWSYGALEKHVIGAHNLLSKNNRADDTDGDGMPDWWEVWNALNPSDASDGAADPDGDGLDNLGEYLAGSNPHLADTDGDMMPDGWEAANGTCPFVSDFAEDPDGDGLANIDEFNALTNPHLADTDGDGCPDGVEVRNARSNPLAADIAWNDARTVGESVPASSMSGATGTWRTDPDGVLYAAQRAGSVAWNLEIPAGGADALAVKVVQHEMYSSNSDFDLTLSVDGVFVARTYVVAPYGHPEDAYFFLPEIAPGAHEFKLVWHNWRVNDFLGIIELRFVDFGGTDADGNGVADWRDWRNSKSTLVDALPLESVTSPLCVEGSDAWRDVLEINVDYPETNGVFTVGKTIGDGFYADIPLAETGATTLTLADRLLVNSFNVVWSEFNVFSGNYAEDPIAIRTGDSLRIGAFDSASTEVTLSMADDSGVWKAITNWTASAAVPFKFEKAGSYLVSASASSGLFGKTNACALVEVVASRFPKRNPAVLLNAPYTLECPGLDARNLVEHDPDMSVAAKVRNAGGVSLEITTHEDRDHGIVSRLAEDGPISDAVQVTPVWADNGTYCRVLRTYADGSQLVEVSLLLGALPEGLSVKEVIFVSGVTFEDGTRTKEFTADDFDENGMVSVRFVKARGVTTSVCHRTYVYQNGNLIYTNE